MKTSLLVLSLMSYSAFAGASTDRDPIASTFKELGAMLKTAASNSLGERIKQGYKIEKVLEVSSGKDIFVLIKS